MPNRPPWFLIVFIAACAAQMQLDAGQQTDAGQTDAGQTDAGVVPPAAFCLSSRCDVDGTWQVSFTRDSGPPAMAACGPNRAPLGLTSDGGLVCMPGADDGSSDGGCGFWFHVSRNGFDWVGSEVWAFDVIDGGALVGTWTVDSTFPPCSASYCIRATR